MFFVKLFLMEWTKKDVCRIRLIKTTTGRIKCAIRVQRGFFERDKIYALGKPRVTPFLSR